MRGEAPFDSMRKMMTTVHDAGGKFMQYTKGAPDEILRRCTHIMTERGVQELTEEKRAEIMSKNKDMADRALRVLAGACREYSQLPQDMSPQALESELVFLGLYGMIDPIRPEVRAAVDKCRDAGIRAVMITGDHIDTAVAIAKDLGILTDPSQAVMGQALDSMSDEELDASIEKYASMRASA